jgi:3-hydroxyisobutyrate dehydrogenase-like beta-hydroxyacid dehydrogenase
MKVGFIGLGRMGQGMARRIFDAGHDLVVYNRTPEKAASLGKAGARIADSIGAAVRDRDVVITMLTDDTALEDVARRDGGLLDSLPRGVIHMAMGTHSIEMMRSLAQAHVQAGQVFVAAPVLGRPDRAAAGELGIIPAGPADVIERLQALFEVMGKSTFMAGSEPEAAAAIKIAHNFVLGCAIEVMGEGMTFGASPRAHRDNVRIARLQNIR